MLNVRSLLATAVLVFSANAGAQNLNVPETTGQAGPTRGTSMQRVETDFGTPTQRRAPVGDPPITRWVYPDFIVYFEFDKVIHSVVTR